MATYGGMAIDESFKAAVDLSSYQYCFVKAGSIAGEVTYAAGGSAPLPLGVLQNDPDATQEATVRIFGVSKLSASGALSTGAASAIAHGDPLTSGSNGKGLHASTCTFSAVALEALASAAGATIKVLVVPPGARLAAEQ
jgi:hypothetical protein